MRTASRVSVRVEANMVIVIINTKIIFNEVALFITNMSRFSC